MIIKINNINDYNYIKENHKEYFYNKTKAEFICSNCNNVSIKSVRYLKIPFLCNNCSCKLSHNTEEYKSNYKNSILKLYGVKYPIQNKEIFAKNRAHYKFNNIIFDSSWELAYYIWLKDNNIDFEYHPKYSFEYEYNNIIHILS